MFYYGLGIMNHRNSIDIRN